MESRTREKRLRLRGGHICSLTVKKLQMLAAALLAICPLFAMAQAADLSAIRQARWEQDIDAFVRCFSAEGWTTGPGGVVLSRGQLDFKKLYPPQQFNAKISALRQSIADRSDAEIVLELMRIVASAHVAHNSVITPVSMGFENALPVKFRWFSDGMIVWLASPAYQQVVGMRVVKIGSMTPENLEKAVAPFISFENGQWLRWNAPDLMRLRPFLDALHLLDSDGCITLTLDRPGEPPFPLKLAFSDRPQAWIGVFSALRTPFPMGFREPNQEYWYRYLADSQTVYINYRSCSDDPKLPFKSFLRSMMADLDAKPVRRMVIDLRSNGGGDPHVMYPLFQALRGHKQWKDNIVVLIGPETFSAAMLDAIALKLDFHATLVGEPTGGKPAFYGWPDFFTLPNSKVIIRFTRHYDPVAKGVDGPALFPDIHAPMSSADLFAGRDPALDAAIQAR